jgi:hypothetical protein
MLRGLVDRRNDAIGAVRQWRDDNETGRREVECHFGGAEWPIHDDVGEHERFGVGFALETNSGGVSDGAVHAICSDNVAGANGSFAAC